MKIGDILKKKPNNIVLNYNNEFLIQEDRYGYYLYKILDDGFEYLGSRSNDPLFKECYPERKDICI